MQSKIVTMDRGNLPLGDFIKLPIGRKVRREAQHTEISRRSKGNFGCWCNRLMHENFGFCRNLAVDFE